MAGGTACLSMTSSIIGVIFLVISVAGIGSSLFLVFGEPLPQFYVRGTYTPYWEDIGKLFEIMCIACKSYLHIATVALQNIQMGPQPLQ